MYAPTNELTNQLMMYLILYRNINNAGGMGQLSCGMGCTLDKEQVKASRAANPGNFTAQIMLLNPLDKFRPMPPCIF